MAKDFSITPAGIYRKCPIRHLPTGWIIYQVEQDHDIFKPYRAAFLNELSQRYCRAHNNENPEPVMTPEIESQDWFKAFSTDAQKKYRSMLTSGTWARAWIEQDPISRKEQRRRDAALETLLQEQENFTATSMETDATDLIAPQLEGASADFDEEVVEHYPSDPEQQSRIAAILAELRDRKSHKVPLEKWHSNELKQIELCFNNLTNQLLDISNIIAEQRQHLALWELRDLEWHLQMVKNRIYWQLQQREDYT